MRDVINWIQSCHLCNATKKPTKPFRSGLQPLPCFRPGECWAMDILGPLKETYSGSKYILVFLDYATKCVEAFPIHETKAHVIARIFVDEIVFRFSAPKKLISDMGSNVVSRVVNEAAQLVGTSRLVTSPYHPQTDGAVERFNHTLVKQLTTLVDAKDRDWDTFVKVTCYSHNTKVCTIQPIISLSI